MVASAATQGECLRQRLNARVPERTDYGSLQAAVSLDKERGLALLAGRLLLALLRAA